MTSFLKRNKDLIAIALVVIVLAVAGVADVFSQSSTTEISRKCPGAFPSPATSKVEISKVGDIALVPCSGRSITINGAGTGSLITSINALTTTSQFFAVGTSGTNFAIASAGSTHTFNLPTASATNRGALSTTDWSIFNNKAPTASPTFTGTISFAGNYLGRDPAYTNATNGWNPATQVSSIQLGDTSTSTIESKSVYGIIVDVQRGQAGAGNHQTSGIRARANIARSAGSGTTTGGEFFAGNIGDTIGTSALQGSEGVAVVTNTGFSAVGVEAFASTAGVTANTLTNLYGFKATNASAASWTVTNVHGLQYTSALAGAAVTNLYGINFSGWTGTAVTNSYGLYMDTSIDRGLTARYAIYLLSTSPSLFSGDLTIGGTGKFYITTPQTPASASAACTVGQQAWDTNFEYRCVATNTWKRGAIATW